MDETNSGLVVLGGLVMSVLAIGPKVCVLKLTDGDGFLRVIQFYSTHSFGGK
jgi:hypothetical protein